MKPSYINSHNKRKTGKGKVVFVIIVLLQLLGVGIYMYMKSDKPADTDSKKDVAAASSTLNNENDPPALDIPSDSTSPEKRPPVVASSPEVKALISDARSSIEAGQLLAAQKTLNKATSISADPEAIALIGDVNMKLLKSARKMDGKIYYSIQPGNSLGRIARKYHTTVELIKQMNGMSTSNIRAGDRVLVFTKPFSVHVSKARNELDLMCDGKIFKRYSVGTGKFGKSPVATFEIVDKIVHPPWTRPKDNKRIEYGDPENLLGSRWMAIKSKDHPEFRGFGIHGTQDRNSIGKQSSNGCIRMLNEEVEELFDLLPRKTVVIISE
jgi:lipoprotein-anchoring transpeptidase ErfK/SrfK